MERENDGKAGQFDEVEVEELDRIVAQLPNNKAPRHDKIKGSHLVPLYFPEMWKLGLIRIIPNNINQRMDDATCRIIKR